MTTGNYSLVERVANLVPEVPKPARKPALQTRLLWTLTALVLYLVMSRIPLYQVPRIPQANLPFLSVIFAANEGTLTSLGIGPIVTGGLVAQILVGSELLRIDLSRPEGRKLFTALTKVLTTFFIVVESLFYAYGRLGSLGVPYPALPVVSLQLILAGFLIYMLDQTVQKGWGIGSGVSLFILAGVALQIMVDLFNPVLVGEVYYGLIPFMIQTALNGNIVDILIRPGGLPSLLGLASTIFFILALVYLEGIRVEIPMASARFRGLRGVYPIKLLYVSNLPVILVGALLGNIQMMALMLSGMVRESNPGLASFLAVYEGPPENQVLRGGLLYYIAGPSDFYSALEDPFRTLVFVAMMVALSVVFAKLWVVMSGMTPSKAAESLIKARMTVPGFRSSRASVEMVLDRYIPVVTVIGGAVVGLIAGVSQFLGVFGGGIGILLMVGIAIQYYQMLVREELELIMPRLAGIFGR